MKRDGETSGTGRASAWQPKSVEAAYVQLDLFDRRHELVEACDDYLSQQRGQPRGLASYLFEVIVRVG